MKSFFGKPFFGDEEQAKAPERGRAIFADSSNRGQREVGEDISPEKIMGIIAQANQGDTRELYQLASEIEERNDVVRHAMETRCAAVASVPWKISAPKDAPASVVAIAETLDKQLRDAGSISIAGSRVDGFDSLLLDMAGAVMPGVSCTEIIWGEGGKLDGFKGVMTRSLHYPSSSEVSNFDRPSLYTSAGDVAFPASKIVLHRRRSPSGDPVRSGLIRSIAWLHCFRNLNFKDLLSFIERYGMPFVVAKVDQATWEKERSNVKRLIRNFGSAGGGLFTQSTELQLLQASNNVGEVYFKLLEYVDAAIEKLLLGQLASSAESTGLSGGDAQSQVRKDLRDADCRAIAADINAQLVAPWTRFNFGPAALRPVFEFQIAPPENLVTLADNLAKLKSAGLEADPEEIGAKFGLKLSRAAAPAPTFGGGSLQLSAEKITPVVAPALSPLTDSARKRFIASGANAWSSRILNEIDAALKDESGEKLKQLGKPEQLKEFNAAPLAQIIEQAALAAAANGMAKKAAQIAASEKGGKA